MLLVSVSFFLISKNTSKTISQGNSSSSKIHFTYFKISPHKFYNKMLCSFRWECQNWPRRVWNFCMNLVKGHPSMLYKEELLGTQDLGCLLSSMCKKTKTEKRKFSDLEPIKWVPFWISTPSKEMSEGSCSRHNQKFDYILLIMVMVEIITFWSMAERTRILGKVLVSGGINIKRILNCGLIKILIRVQFLMEMIKPMDLDLFVLLVLLIWTLQGCKFGDWVQNKITKTMNNTGKVAVLSKFIFILRI